MKTLPASIPYPTTPAVDPHRIPVGLDLDGNVVEWNLPASVPHGLVVGDTGSGKSGALRALAMGSILRDIPVKIVVPKRLSLAGLRGWPGERGSALHVSFSDQNSDPNSIEMTPT